MKLKKPKKKVEKYAHVNPQSFFKSLSGVYGECTGNYQNCPGTYTVCPGDYTKC